MLNHPGSDATFTITRTFDAPRELVWRAWTDEKHLQQWFGPAGFDRVQYRNDFRAGGSLHYALRAPDGTEIWGKWIYREIAPPERLTFVMSFSNPEGGITRHPMSPTWPAETLSTITFSERDGKTTVTLTAIPINESTEERDTFVLGRPSMTQGWGGTFELLEKYLANERTAR
ncbi:MAG: SRPBCC domain-containing protein [Acidobacteriota bacterium]|nr:SRPBCC domain-containing protein [Acidobacteriota bacterium]